jgi:asparagine synthase (glutamine-hydrolysing)
MCGIFGIFTTYLLPAFELHGRLDAGLGALHHRGPDDRGLERFTLPSGVLALGHSRLSSIDLSCLSCQKIGCIESRKRQNETASHGKM